MRINRVKLATHLILMDMTGLQLGEISGLSRSTITAVRAGKSCRRETAEKIAAALGIPLSEIVEG